MKGNSQSRKWQLTINNPQVINMSLADLEEKAKELSPEYYCLCEEIANTGTHHFHLFMYSHSPKRFSTIKKCFPTAHIEKAYASCKINREYIEKSGKWEDDHKSDTKVEGTFRECGVMPSERDEKHPELALLVERVKNGASIMEIVDEFPQYAMQTRNINELRMRYCGDCSINNIRDVKVVYIMADGKFDSIGFIYSRHDYKDVCRITNYREGKGVSFDTYQFQPVIVFESFEEQVGLAQMIAYTGDYPVTLPARYEDRAAVYNMVYIVSCLPPERLYAREKARNPGLWDRFQNCIDTLIKVDEDGVIEEVNLNVQQG